MKPQRFAGFAFAGTLAICGCQKDTGGRVASGGPQARSGQEAPAVKWNLELTGSGLGRPVTFTYEQLAAMEITRLENVRQQMSHFPDKVESWQGVALDSLLAEAQIKPGPMRFTLVAADGYKMECTRAHLRSAIIALQDGSGRWLAEIGRRRPIKLVPPHATGDYWVRNLVQIIVEAPAPSGSSG